MKKGMEKSKVKQDDKKVFATSYVCTLQMLKNSITYKLRIKHKYLVYPRCANAHNYLGPQGCVMKPRSEFQYT